MDETRALITLSPAETLDNFINGPGSLTRVNLGLVGRDVFSCRNEAK